MQDEVNNLDILDEPTGDGTKDSNSNDQNLEFLPPLPMAAVEIARQAPRAIRTARQLASGDIEGAARTVGLDEAAELVRELKEATQTLPRMKGGGGGGGTPVSSFTVLGGGSGGGSGNNNPMPNSYLNMTRLNIEPHPTEVRMMTGIKPDAFTPDYNFSEINYCYPVHYTGNIFQFPASSDTTSTLGNFWNNTIVRELYVTVQKNITFSVSSAGLTQAKIVTYMNDLAYALQVFYAATRYYVYIQDPKNKNEGLFAIANTLNSDVSDTYISLRRLLRSLPIPPNLNTFLYYLMQHYVAEDLPSSPIIGIVPFAFNSSNVMEWTCLSQALVNLSSSDNVSTSSTLGRAIPSWYATTLLSGNAVPLHDPNFTTIWTNLPFQLTGTSPSEHAVRGPAITDNDSRIYYNSFTENLDGGAYALCGGYNGTTWLPSIMKPVPSTFGTNSSTRFSWAFNTFQDTYIYTAATYARDETYISSSVELNSTRLGIPIGSQRVWGVTARTICNSGVQLLDYVMSWSTVAAASDKRFSEAGPFDPAADKFTGMEYLPNKSKKTKGRKSKFKPKSNKKE